MDCLTSGRWQQLIAPTNITDVHAHAGYACRRQFTWLCATWNTTAAGKQGHAARRQLERSRRIATWSWSSALRACARQHDVLSSAARALQSRRLRLVLVGDSMTELMFISLECLLGRHVSTQESTALELQLGKDLPTAASVKGFAFHGGGSVVYVRQDDFESGAPVQVPASVFQSELVRTADILVLNTGNHFRGSLDEYGAMALRIARLVAKQAAATSIIYRSSVPGHSGCENATRPLKHADRRRAAAFNWATFRAQDDSWRTAFATLPPSRFRFFDVTYASSLRPDAHAAARAPSGVMDCLHFCLPGGPVDEWTRHLLAGLFGKT